MKKKKRENTWTIWKAEKKTQNKWTKYYFVSLVRIWTLLPLNENKLMNVISVMQTNRTQKLRLQQQHRRYIDTNIHNFRETRKWIKNEKKIVCNLLTITLTGAYYLVKILMFWWDTFLDIHSSIVWHLFDSRCRNKNHFRRSWKLTISSAWTCSPWTQQIHQKTKKMKGWMFIKMNGTSQNKNSFRFSYLLSNFIRFKSCAALYGISLVVAIFSATLNCDDRCTLYESSSE